MELHFFHCESGSMRRRRERAREQSISRYPLLHPLPSPPLTSILSTSFYLLPWPVLTNVWTQCDETVNECNDVGCGNAYNYKAARWVWGQAYDDIGLWKIYGFMRNLTIINMRKVMLMIGKGCMIYCEKNKGNGCEGNRFHERDCNRTRRCFFQ